MKKSISLRMLLRSPIKTAVTLVLIAAASFLFLYNLLDYAMTKRNYDRTYSQYHGYLSVLHPEDRLVGREVGWDYARNELFFLSDPAANPAYAGYPSYEANHLRSLTEEELETVSALPYVSRVEKRYMTGGIADFDRTYTYNGNDSFAFFHNTSRIVFEGTLDLVYKDELKMVSDAFGLGTKLSLRLTDVKLISGQEKDLEQSRLYIDEKSLYVQIYVSLPEREEEFVIPTGLYVRSGGFVKNWLNWEDLEALVPGERYLFVASVDPYASGSTGIQDEEWVTARFPYVYLGDDSLYSVCDYFTPLTGEPENYLETEKFAGVRQMLEIMETDRRTLDVHYLENMNTLKRYQEGKLMPVQGRMLTAEDSENHDPVCVIPEDMARAQGLGLGDTLRLKLGDTLMEQYAPFGAVAFSTLRYAENWTEQDFTVIGTYTESGLNRLSTEDQFWAYGENAVFVPLSFLPETADTRDHTFKPAEVSFIVEDADSIAPFRDEVLPRLEALGLTYYFYDGNWPAVQEQLHQAGSLTLVKLCAFALSAILVLCLTVYLYILRKKKEFAVMRALGCPAGEAQKALLFPLLILAVPAVLLGSIGAMIYTRFAAAANAAEFAVLGLAMDAELPLGMVAVGFGGSLLFLLVLAWAALRSVAGKQPLELLQGGTNRNAGRQTAALPTESGESMELSPLPRLEPPVYHKHTGLGHTLRYVGKHLRRTPAKTLLSLLLAVVLCFSIGFFTLLRNTYRDLYQNIEIHPRFLNGFSYNTAKEVEKSGYVRDPYYEYVNTLCESNFVADTLVLTSDLSRVTEAEVTWREDKGPEIFSQTNSFCVISRDLAEKLGYELGSRLEITRLDRLTYLSIDRTELTMAELVELYHQTAHHLTVAGIVEEEGMRVYAGVVAWQCFGTMFSDYVPLDLAEYTLEDYHKAAEFRSYAWRLLTGKQAVFSMETAEADRVYQTYRLLELLYPIAFALALILGGVLPAGIILQSAKEASLLRVLGTTKRRTRVMLSLEQIFLCLLGLCMAVAALVLTKGNALTAVAGLIAVYAAAHLLSCVVGTEAAAVSVTRRNVLELLQVKE